MAYVFSTLYSKSTNYGNNRAKESIKYIVLHYTANKTDTAAANAKYFHNNTLNASAHYFVDGGNVIQSVPDLTIAYAVGGTKIGNPPMHKKITNANSISIEMCSTNGMITDATMQNAINLVIELMNRYNIPVSNVYRHYDVTGKKCPGWAGWTGADESIWESFKAQITGARWVQYQNGKWWYQNSDGSYKKSEWYQECNGDWYYFDKDGYMATYCYVKSTDKDLYYWMNKDGIWEPEWNTTSPDLSKYKLVK